MRKLFILPTLIAASLAISACSYHEGSSYNNHDRKHDNREYPRKDKDQRPPQRPNNDRDQYNQKDRPNQNNLQQRPTTGKNDKVKRSFQGS